MLKAHFILWLGIFAVGTALAEAEPPLQPSQHRNTINSAGQAPRRIIVQTAPPEEEDEADTRGLQEIAARAQKAIQSDDRDQLVLAILNLLPYYYEENAREGGSNENYEQILRELVSAGIIAGGPSPDPFSGLQTALDREGTAVFDSVGRKEKVEAPAAEKKPKAVYAESAEGAMSASGSTPSSETSGGATTTTTATAAARVEDGAFASNSGSTSADPNAPVAAPVSKRRARAPRRNVATQLMASLLESLKAKNASAVISSRAKTSAPTAALASLKPRDAAAAMPELSPASAISPGVFTILEKEQRALMRDGLGWAGWGIVLLFLIVRQIRFMSRHHRRERVRRHL